MNRMSVSFPSAPPATSRGIFSDLRYFLFARPEVETRVIFATRSDRERYSRRILQRVGQDVRRFRILNIHRIGIRAPVSFVFEELLRWDGDSTCWPNHIAGVERQDGLLEHIKIFLGKARPPCRTPRRKIIRPLLFDLNAVTIRRVPEPMDQDNARYLLYDSSGGYPIGIFIMYVRSAIPEQKEKEPAQLFLVVGFNFYGREKWSGENLITRLWQNLHNRVTANVLNRFKQLCEWKASRWRSNEPPASD